MLLTYGWVRSSYAVLRNLSSHDVDVHVADSFRTGMCQSSRLKRSFDRYVSHYEDEERFVEDMVDICRRRGIGIIFPSHNETEILARYRHRFSEKQAALLPSAEHCALFNNKVRAYDHAASLGVPVPARLEYESPGDVARAMREAGLADVVIKLRSGNSSKGVFYAADADEAQKTVQALVARYDLEALRYPQIEARVKGEGWGRSMFYWHGRPVAGFTHRRLREKVSTGGTSTLREVAHHPGIEEAAARMLTDMGWHGLAMVEFKVCPQTGRYWFIEVNPRLWGSIPLAISAGVEFPYLAWLCATKGVEAAIAYQATCLLREPWRARWLLGDMMAGLRDRLYPRDIGEPEAKSIRADVVDDLYWDDPLVFPGEMLRYSLAALSKRSLNGAEKGMIG